MILTYEKFFSCACVVLGSLAAALIAIPISLHLFGYIAPFLIITMAGLGALLGYRRRTSRLFFYACLLAILVISSLLL